MFKSVTRTCGNWAGLERAQSIIDKMPKNASKADKIDALKRAKNNCTVKEYKGLVEALEYITK